jgi:hypothetical protein
MRWEGNHEWKIRKDLNGDGRGLLESSIKIFAWRDCEKVWVASWYPIIRPRFEPDISRNIICNEALFKPTASTYLEDKDLTCRPVDVKFAVGRVISVNALTREKVHDVLWSILVAICCCHLQSQPHSNRILARVRQPLIWGKCIVYYTHWKVRPTDLTNLPSFLHGV